MCTPWQRLAVATLLMFAVAAARPADKQAPRQPNFLVIVADDLGYTDIGAFGGEIDTPNLDRLAARGTRLTSFYTAPTCSPTRAMLLTGRDHHEVGLGAMAETPRHLKPADAPGYEGYLTANVRTLPQRLAEAGYLTAMVGKWHLGLESDQSPAARGFERSFALLQGAHNHYGADQHGALTTLGGHSTYSDGGRPASYPTGRYSSDVFTDRMIEYLSDRRDRDRPYFAYLAYTAPHWPLQAPEQLIAKQRGRYDTGPAALRERRRANVERLGLLPPGHPVAVDDLAPRWAALPADARAASAKAMEVYAAMVEQMDANIGRLLDELERIDRLDNTVIVFMSDNGAEGLDSIGRLLTAITGNARSLDTFDNRPMNAGHPDSFVLYGPAWAQASMGPFLNYKGFTTEGGIRAPAIVAGPGIRRGVIESQPTHVLDVVPTLLQRAGLAASTAIAQLRGTSLVDLLSEGQRLPERTLFWEFQGGRAIRVGDWKAVRRFNPLAGVTAESWRLFDLAGDPGETRDLAASQPARLESLITQWEAYAVSVGVVNR